MELTKIVDIDNIILKYKIELDICIPYNKCLEELKEKRKENIVRFYYRHDPRGTYVFNKYYYYVGLFQWGGCECTYRDWLLISHYKLHHKRFNRRSNGGI